MCRSLTDLLRGRLKSKAPRRAGGYFRTDADHRDFTAIGTAAGTAAAPQIAWQCIFAPGRLLSAAQTLVSGAQLDSGS